MATRTLGSRNGIAFRLAVVHSLARSLAALVVAAAGILGAGSVHSQGLNLDVAYGVGGKAAAHPTVDVPVGTINPLRATSMPDGKILAFGIQYASSTYWLIAIRYSSDGTVDTTFGDGGRIVSPPFPSTFSPSQMPNSVAALADGRFLVAGQRSGAAVLRLLASGAPDPSFGSGGVASTGINGTGTVVIPQTDGRILVGSSNNSSPNGLSVARLTSSGQLDPSFGTGGVAGIRVGTTGVDWVVALALQPDGRVVAAGYANNGSNLDFAGARFMADGTPDNAFGPAGN